MKVIAMLISILLCHFSYGQFAIVADNDGYVNVRADTGLGSKIKDTLHNDHVVYCFDPTGRWISIEYSTGKYSWINGYIYHDRLKRISDFENIPRTSRDACRFGKDSLIVEVTAKPFIKSNYHLTYDKGSLQLVNGKGYLGTDGEVPKTTYKSIIVTIGSKMIELPRAAPGRYEAICCRWTMCRMKISPIFEYALIAPCYSSQEVKSISIQSIFPTRVGNGSKTKAASSNG